MIDSFVGILTRFLFKLLPLTTRSEWYRWTQQRRESKLLPLPALETKGYNDSRNLGCDTRKLPKGLFRVGASGAR